VKSRSALLGGVIVLAAVLVYVLHDGDSKSETAPSDRKAENAAASVPRVATRTTAGPRLGGVAPVAKPADVEHANIVGLPDVLEPGYLAFEHAAKTCYRGRKPTPTRPNGPDETIETIKLSYRQVISGGVGHVEDLKVVDDKVTDETLSSCIVKATAAATWSQDVPDGELGEVAQNVNLGDLMRPDVGLPPVSQRSPPPTAPPLPELAGPLGQQAETVEDDHAGVVVSDPALASQNK
jgi:hypothetical protein